MDGNSSTNILPPKVIHKMEQLQKAILSIVSDEPILLSDLGGEVKDERRETGITRKLKLICEDMGLKITQDIYGCWVETPKNFKTSKNTCEVSITVKQQQTKKQKRMQLFDTTNSENFLERKSDSSIEDFLSAIQHEQNARNYSEEEKNDDIDDLTLQQISNLCEPPSLSANTANDLITIRPTGSFFGCDNESNRLFINTDKPFCAVAIGVQGSGKSHTTSTLIESCMIVSPPLLNPSKTCSTLVFHYDMDPTNFCEAATLVMPSKLTNSDCVAAVEEAIILVSPSYFIRRKKFYESLQNVKIIPLLFKWEDLSAAQLKSLMRLNNMDEAPLYMSVLLNLLRKFQKQNKLPAFAHFQEILLQEMSKNQSQPLNQRMSLLESFIYESEENDDLKKDFVDLADVFQSGRLVIADLTDPMMSSEEANGVFEVLLNQFREKQLDCPKLVVLDEAHKYLTSKSSDPLSSTLVECVRLIRHHGMKVIVSSQSPKTLPSELLELSSLVVCHNFHSLDWFHHLRSKIPLDENCFEQITKLHPGDALTFCSKWYDAEENGLTRLLRIRKRLTADGGASRIFQS